MIESEGITENVESWRTDVISAITSSLPKDKIMWVPYSIEFKWRPIHHPNHLNPPTPLILSYRFEAADPKGGHTQPTHRPSSIAYTLLIVFAYHIQNQGADANLFIDHSQIVQLACLRKGIWGTGGTFSRVVTFEGYQGSLAWFVEGAQ